MTPTSGRVYLRWDEKIDIIFINTLLEQRQHGQKIVSDWSLMAYNKASFNLKREANLDVTAEHCKTWWKSLKANHLLRDPSVKNYQDKTIPYYRDLNILVRKDYATGTEVGTGNDETNILQEVDNDGVESVYSTIDERTPNRVSSSTTPGTSASSTGALAPKKKKLKEIPTLSKDDLMKILFYHRDNDGVARGFLAVSQDSKNDYLQYEMKNIQ
ncbi:hypothetical protein GIB67_000546 [Kingdonia uniflora]|uniref:Myb/SANT-like domain-containing protein n=1 Tax=Kingdonia uniflora TaxID=39325 RepID=A0A7J7MIL6_9MAGN|nr:hypothetical protein GIB67_000546 [Kingdonia uniflora]